MDGIHLGIVEEVRLCSEELSVGLEEMM